MLIKVIPRIMVQTIILGTYLWSTGEITASINTGELFADTDYTVTVTAVGGCAGVGSVTVTVSPIPFDLLGGGTFCANEAIVTAVPDTNWVVFITPPNVSADANSGTFTITASGIYLISALNTNGCQATDTVIVTLNPPVNAVITGGSTVCEDFPTTLTASGGNNYLWSNGSTNASITVLYADAGPYSVTVTGANGCTGTASVSVMQSQVCCVPPTTAISISGSVLSSAAFVGTTISNTDIYVNGTLFINNNMTFVQCRFTMQPGSKIIVQSGNTLTLTDNTLLFGCNRLWRGISVNSGAKLIISNVLIADALVGIDLADNATLRTGFTTNINGFVGTFSRNYIGVRCMGGVVNPTIAADWHHCQFNSAAGTPPQINQNSTLLPNYDTLGLVDFPFPRTDVPYTGIHLEGLENPLSIHHCSFDGLSRGVAAIHSNQLMLSTDRFTNINTLYVPNKVATMGVAVYGERVGSLSVMGTNNTGTFDFDNCRWGIFATRTALRANNNTMDNIWRTGIFVGELGANNTLIHGNSITAAERCIHLNLNGLFADIEVSNNLLTVGDGGTGIAHTEAVQVPNQVANQVINQKRYKRLKNFPSWLKSKPNTAALNTLYFKTALRHWLWSKRKTTLLPFNNNMKSTAKR